MSKPKTESLDLSGLEIECADLTATGDIVAAN